MKLKDSKLRVKQLDRRMQDLLPLTGMDSPKEGWVSLVRKTLNMSLRQLGGRLSITPQGVRRIETSEASGTITLNALRQVGDALEMKLVYGFVPKNGSLEKMIERRAGELAKQIVLRTSASMKLEDQENSRQRIEEAIVEMTNDLKREMPKSLWD